MLSGKIVAVLALLLIPAGLVLALDAPKLKSEKDVQALCEQALTNIVKGDVSSGIGALRPYASSISAEDVDSLENQLTSQAQTIMNNYGDALGFLLMSKDNLKDTVLQLVYVVKYQKHLIRWTFIFYKPTDSWVLDYFNYDDSIETLFGPKNPPTAK